MRSERLRPDRSVRERKSYRHLYSARIAQSCQVASWVGKGFTVQ